MQTKAPTVSHFIQQQGPTCTGLPVALVVGVTGADHIPWVAHWALSVTGTGVLNGVAHRWKKRKVTYRHLGMHGHECMCMCACMCACMYTCMCLCLCVCVCVCMSNWTLLYSHNMKLQVKRKCSRLTQKVNYNFDYTNSSTDTIMTIWIWQISLTQPLIKTLIKVSAKSRDTLNTPLNVYKKHVNHDLILCMDVINTSTILQRNITHWHPRDFEIRS